MIGDCNYDWLFGEINALQFLDHPNVARLHEAFCDEKYCYVVTEYFVYVRKHRLCTGGTLFERLEKKRDFSERDAARVMRELMSAVAYSHKNNILHRNISPETLLLDSGDKSATIKTINFGLSKLLDPDLKMLLRLGDPLYIAPEVFLKTCTAKSDVWSCGVILYILLSGIPPFIAATRSKLFHKIQRGIFTTSGHRWDSVSNSAKDLVKKMMTRDPARRYSAAEVLSHPWIRSECREELESTEVKFLLSKLRSFSTQCKLEQDALSYIVSQLTTNKEKRLIQSVFLSLDRNSDGKLESAELIQGYKKAFGEEYPAEQDVEHIMQHVDTTGDGYIGFTEFLMATINKKSVLSWEKLAVTFNRFDVDGRGAISAEGVDDVFRNEIDATPGCFDKAMQKEGSKKNGEISFEEFLMIMSRLLCSE
eukprot:TRINITY_DN6013_c0_g1_i21.p1 TRINITY_DN6013_c0_g1~~TRINITY_DN6013_c0_g1_i21.p1  ORF type:complete len:422 (+),score=103.74 TRINITY_DN6013_c0_g1_i21:427-1692(+)